MPAIVVILWLPAAIAIMSVTWVLTLSAVDKPGTKRSTSRENQP